MFCLRDVTYRLPKHGVRGELELMVKWWFYFPVVSWTPSCCWRGSTLSPPRCRRCSWCRGRPSRGSLQQHHRSHCCRLTAVCSPQEVLMGEGNGVASVIMLHSVSECGFQVPKTYQAPAHIWDLPRWWKSLLLMYKIFDMRTFGLSHQIKGPTTVKLAIL